MLARMIEWARSSIRGQEAACLWMLAIAPYFIVLLVISHGLFHGHWMSGIWSMLSIIVFLSLVQSLSNASLSRRTQEERLLVYWLLSGMAIPLGMVASVAGVLLVELDREASPWKMMSYAGWFAAGLGAVNVLLFQIYHRIEINGRS